MLIGILIIILLSVYIITALISFNPADPGWMQHVQNDSIDNIGGSGGAFLADFLFFMFGNVAYFIPLLILLNFWFLFFRSDKLFFVIFLLRTIGLLIFLFISCLLAQITFNDVFYFPPGGIIGNIILNLIQSSKITMLHMSVYIFYLGIIFFLCFFNKCFLKIIHIIQTKIIYFIRFIFVKYIYSNREYQVKQAYFNTRVSPLFFLKQENKINNKLNNCFYENNKNLNEYIHKTAHYTENNKLNYQNASMIIQHTCFKKKIFTKFIHNMKYYSIGFKPLFYKNAKKCNSISIINKINFQNKKKLNVKILNYNKKSFLMNSLNTIKRVNKKNIVFSNAQSINNIQFLNPSNKIALKPVNITSKNKNRLNLSKIVYSGITKMPVLNEKYINISSVLPSINFLSSFSQKKTMNYSKSKDISKLIEKKLLEFRISANVVKIISGPVVTCFELSLSAGTKSSKVSSLSRDLARALSVSFVQILEVIPGTPYIGLEIPNKKRDVVYLKDIINSNKFQNMNSPLSLVLGKDRTGNPIVVDLRKMPHLLIAGTTGSGKSIGINVMIISILYKATPRDVRFIMIDPKILELAVYTKIPHLLQEVVTDMKDAESVLTWCVQEMDRRYSLMSKLNVRNLENYNYKIKQYMERNIISNIFPFKEFKKLPYIVIIIDELSDLMMLSSKTVEMLITRLTQKSRAAGIHLILSTQRPSVDVITGLIKANIPSRIAFTVSSTIDSRTIIGQSGAESLLGMGDMLYLPSNSAVPIRIHGAYIQDQEIFAVVNFWRKQGKVHYDG